jgi:hypothetical protein
MHRNLTLALALAAGLLGGFLSRYITPSAVHAQVQPPSALEVRAQRFSVVDAQGRVIGTFTGAIMKEPSGRARPGITLVDPTGRELWSAGGHGFKELSESSK